MPSPRQKPVRASAGPISLLFALALLGSCARISDGIAIVGANRDFEAGRIHDALAVYMRVGADAFERANAYNIANGFSAIGEFEPAEAMYKQASASSDRRVSASAWHNYGVALFNAGRYEEAAAAFRQSLLAVPGRPSSIQGYELSLASTRPSVSGGSVERAPVSMDGYGGDSAIFKLSSKQERSLYLPGASSPYAGVDH
jgi:tetratricopeptide (TPR) repeat protein